MAFRTNSIYSCAFKGTSAQWLDYNTSNKKELKLEKQVRKSGIVDWILCPSTLQFCSANSPYFVRKCCTIGCSITCECYQGNPCG